MRGYNSVQDDIDHQLEILRRARQRLAVLVKQSTTFGIGGAPHIEIEIGDVRNQIANIKSWLRSKGVEVEDQLNDEAQPEKTSIPVGSKIRIEIDNENKILVMPNAVFAIFRKAMKDDYGVDISEFLVGE